MRHTVGWSDGDWNIFHAVYRQQRAALQDHQVTLR
jgi:hypothetical protein